MKNSPIGYALPSPLLGLPLSDIPVAPWESYTVCSADNCEENAAVSDTAWRENPGQFWWGCNGNMADFYFDGEI